jgi:hypothetical protein
MLKFEHAVGWSFLFGKLNGISVVSRFYFVLQFSAYVWLFRGPDREICAPLQSCCEANGPTEAALFFS